MSNKKVLNILNDTMFQTYRLNGLMNTQLNVSDFEEDILHKMNNEHIRMALE